MSGLAILATVSGGLTALFIVMLILGLRYDIDALWISGLFCSILFGLCAIILGSVSLGNDINAKREQQEWQEKRIMIELVVENGGEYDNVGISNTIIEYNNWLAEVKVSKDRYGIFSSYYAIDISDMEYLTLPKKDSE